MSSARQFFPSLVLALAAALLPASPAAAANACTQGLLPGGQDFSGKNLINTNFSGQNLQNANFTGAQLSGAVFTNANLTGATFANANMATVTTATNFGGANLTNACFENANLTGASLQYATFDCTGFPGANLIDTTFGPVLGIATAQSCRVDFSNAAIPATAVPLSQWQYVDFDYTQFVGLSPPASPNFAGQNMQYSQIQGIELGGFDLTGTIFDDSDLTAADLRGATLANASFIGATLDAAQLQLAVATGADFYDGASRPGVYASLTGVTADNSDFSNADLSFTNLQSTVFAGAVMRGANFQAATLEGSTSTLTAAQMNAADLTGAQFLQAHLNNVNFTNSYLTGANFQNTTLSGTNFSKTLLAEAQFQGAALQGVSFAGATIENAKFTGAQIAATTGGAQVDFSCSQLGGADFTNAAVSGTSFQSAVMPPAALCCPQISGGTYCGSIAIDSTPYGATILPQLTAPVICPNGQQAVCSGSQWQVSSNWQSTYCSSDHAAVQLWSPPDCSTGGGGSGGTVNIPDANLLACLQQAIFGPGVTDPIPVATAAEVDTVNCPSRGISDLTGLASFTGVRSIDLTGNSIASADILTSLLALEVVKVGSNQLQEMNLAGLSRLIYLDASNNSLANLDGLASVYFQYLDLSNNQLQGVLNISVQTDLFFADLSNNQLTGLYPGGSSLTALRKLTYLDVESNRLATLGDVSGLVPQSGALQDLSVACNTGFDCAGLESSLGTSRAGQGLYSGSGCGITTVPPCPPPTN